ncbi:hypothetical protein CALVIDRAFT_540764 [Calocera viscosa TUFC12733]|uniref:F-box domain-containing protein n=1 Tax=Calocera viscosa (strain TUFC12733) TaxID=1330018 RepID=A0A167IIP2_CALVF|nr:hypothetical protein CALVIDRAFT_540764 [Calocera viscosa TUFC12733]
MEQHSHMTLHAAKLQATVDAAKTLVDTLGDIPVRTIIRSRGPKSLNAVLHDVYELEDTVQRLLRKVDELRNRLFSPTARLPDEILQEIFLYCRDAIVQTRTSTPDRFNPEVLTHVCRRWRMIALDTGVLWAQSTLAATSSLQESRLNPRHMLLPVERFSYIRNGQRRLALLDRSKEVPLSLYLKFPSGSNTQPLTDELSRIVRRERQIDRLNIRASIDCDDATSASLALAQHTVRWLKITRRRKHSNPAELVRGINGSDILSKEWPRLRHLVLDGISLPRDPASPYLLLSDLRTLDLSLAGLAVDIVCLIPVLSLCNPTLERLTIRFGYASQRLVSLDYIIYPRLRRLELSGGQGNIIQLLERIRAPSLTALYIGNLLGESQRLAVINSVGSALISLLQASGCAVRLLSLTEVSGAIWRAFAGTSAAITVHSIRYGSWGTGLQADDDAIELENGLLQFPNLEELCENRQHTVQSLRNLLSCVKVRKRLHGNGVMMKPIRRLAMRAPFEETARGLKTEADIQMQLGQLVDEMVVGDLQWHRATNQWLSYQGGGDWLYKRPEDQDI